MLNEIELKELHDEYSAISEKINSLRSRQLEIDLTINNNSKEVIASKFIPLEFGDKIKVVIRNFRPFFEKNYTYSEHIGIFGSWVLDGHQYSTDNGVGSVKLRLYQIKKDGTRSLKYDEFFNDNIVSIEKVEE